jgi:hypothetical protein
MRQIAMLAVLVVMVGCATYPPMNTSNFSTQDRALIADTKIGIGMSEQALLASWGRVGEYRPEFKGWVLASIRTHVSPYSETRIYTYKNSGTWSNSYKSVYVRNGHVTHWSY